MDASVVSDALREIAILLELKGENPFKARAYESAARTIESLGNEFEDIIQQNKIGEIKGIGESIAEKIITLVTASELPYLNELRSSIEPGLLELLKIPGLGPKRVKAIFDKLRISKLGELEYACKENRLSLIDGFGEKLQEKILEGIEQVKKYSERFLYIDAEEFAFLLYESLKPIAAMIEIAGSIRRKRETVKDIDLIAATDNRDKLINEFINHQSVEKVLLSGDTKTSVLLTSGMQADLRVVEPSQYPYALHHFTGSKEHHTALRGLAKKRNIKINEYGIFENDKLIECKSEDDIYRVFKMSFIPPELRENMGEIEAAIENKLPKLVEQTDIKGVFHIHTNYSDGRNTIEELVCACIERGWAYIGITDHSKSAAYAGGLSVDDIKRQREEIAQVQEKYPSFKLFHGIECDILKSGELDYPDDILERFDFVIASVHSNFTLDEKSMTQRIIKAIKNPYTTILGHPTGRLLLARKAYPVNLQEILATSAETGTIIEINSNPHRLDLDWLHIKHAKDLGIKFAISPDAHDIFGLDYVKFGVYIARKGWLEVSNLINALCSKDVMSMLDVKFR